MFQDPNDKKLYLYDLAYQSNAVQFISSDLGKTWSKAENVPVGSTEDDDNYAYPGGGYCYDYYYLFTRLRAWKSRSPSFSSPTELSLRLPYEYSPLAKMFPYQGGICIIQENGSLSFAPTTELTDSTTWVKLLTQGIPYQYRGGQMFCIGDDIYFNAKTEFKKYTFTFKEDYSFTKTNDGVSFKHPLHDQGYYSIVVENADEIIFYHPTTKDTKYVSKSTFNYIHEEEIKDLEVLNFQNEDKKALLKEILNLPISIYEEIVEVNSSNSYTYTLELEVDESTALSTWISITGNNFNNYIALNKSGYVKLSDSLYLISAYSYKTSILHITLKSTKEELFYLNLFNTQYLSSTHDYYTTPITINGNVFWVQNKNSWKNYIFSEALEADFTSSKKVLDAYKSIGNDNILYYKDQKVYDENNKLVSIYSPIESNMNYWTNILWYEHENIIDNGKDVIGNFTGNTYTAKYQTLPVEGTIRNGFVNKDSIGMLEKTEDSKLYWYSPYSKAIRDPSAIRPSMFLSCGTLNYTGEVGSTFTKPSITITIRSVGSYTYGCTDGISDYDAKDTGILFKTGDITITSKSDTISNSKDYGKGEALTLYSTEDNVFLDTVISIPFSVTANYTASNRIPYNNLKTQIPTKQIASGTLTDNCTFKYTGYRNCFYGALTSVNSSFTSASVRNLPNKTRVTDADYLDIDIDSTVKQIVYAIPATKSISKIKNKEGTDILSEFIITTIPVNGANNSNAIDYKIYTYTVPDGTVPEGETSYRYRAKITKN